MSFQRPKVSIIMGIYNNVGTISTAIDSIINQTFRDWEFIICDDASIDGSSKILDEYAGKWQNIKIIRNEKNLGLAASLNKCLEHVSGKYVARMDGDDISLPQRLEKQVQFLDENLEYSVVSTAMISFNDMGDQYIISNIYEPTRTDIVKRNPFHHATILMRSDVYCRLGGYRVLPYTRRTEDVDLWFRFFASGFKGVNLSDALYKVREDKNAFRRRKLRYSIDASITMFIGIRLLKMPIHHYIYILKPVISWMIPQFLKEQLRNKSVTENYK